MIAALEYNAVDRELSLSDETLVTTSLKKLIVFFRRQHSLSVNPHPNEVRVRKYWRGEAKRTVHLLRQIQTRGLQFGL